MKVAALVFKLRNGAFQVFIDSLNTEIVRDMHGQQLRAFPETAPVLVSIEIPVEGLWSEANSGT